MLKITTLKIGRGNSRRAPRYPILSSRKGELRSGKAPYENLARQFGMLLLEKCCGHNSHYVDIRPLHDARGQEILFFIPPRGFNVPGPRRTRYLAPSVVDQVTLDLQNRLVDQLTQLSRRDQSIPSFECQLPFQLDLKLFPLRRGLGATPFLHSFYGGMHISNTTAEKDNFFRHIQSSAGQFYQDRLYELMERTANGFHQSLLKDDVMAPQVKISRQEDACLLLFHLNRADLGVIKGRINFEGFRAEPFESIDGSDLEKTVGDYFLNRLEHQFFLQRRMVFRRMRSQVNAVGHFETRPKFLEGLRELPDFQMNASLVLIPHQVHGGVKDGQVLGTTVAMLLKPMRSGGYDIDRYYDHVLAHHQSLCETG